MLINIAIATLMLIITCAIHGAAMTFVMHQFASQESEVRQRLERLFWVSGTVLLMFLASVAEVFVWAVTYLIVNAIEGAEQAFYFSMVTYTTLGYGDVLLAERWRVLGSFEAANGIIMFGWTTAVVVAAVHRLYVRRDG
jgi:hypothetical protein